MTISNSNSHNANNKQAVSVTPSTSHQPLTTSHLRSADRIRLGLDASLRVPSCAVATNAGIVRRAIVGKPTEKFSSLIRDTLFEAHVRLDELEEIVVSVGPGSQMGTRTTVATGNALALALGIPISGVLSVDALAAGAPVSESLNAAVSDGRGRWYVAAYKWEDDKLQRLGGLQLSDELPPDALLSTETDSAESGEERLGASGILVIADKHRHLLRQSFVQEVRPYERGEG